MAPRVIQDAEAPKNAPLPDVRPNDWDDAPELPMTVMGLPIRPGINPLMLLPASWAKPDSSFGPTKQVSTPVLASSSESDCSTKGTPAGTTGGTSYIHSGDRGHLRAGRDPRHDRRLAPRCKPLPGVLDPSQLMVGFGPQWIDSGTHA